MLCLCLRICLLGDMLILIEDVTFPLCAQALSSEIDEKIQSLQRLNELSQNLGRSSNDQGFTDEVQGVTRRVHASLPTVRDKSNRLSTMLRCFEHQQCTQKHITFLKEVKSRLEVEFCVDGVVDAENELENIKVRSLVRRMSLPRGYYGTRNK